MPPAGAIVPPSIIPLRKQVPGRPSTLIDTSTYIELETEDPDCKIYFSTDGTKPNPFQLKSGGRETTFKYRGPFTLKNGKRTLKVVAVSRDGLHESNVVTKTFNVDDTGPPDSDIESFFGETEDDSIDLFFEEKEKRKNTRKSMTGSVSKKKKNLRNSSSKPDPFEAWGASTSTVPKYSVAELIGDGYKEPGATTNNASIPDGPFNATNYSGTQINVWGVAPQDIIPQTLNGGGYNGSYGNYPAQLGMMTNNMIAGCSQGKTVSLEQLRRMMKDEASKAAVPPPPPPQPVQPAIEYVKEEPTANAESPGGGDWKGNCEHIYAHLLELCKRDSAFKGSVGRPTLGKIHRADLVEEDDAFLMTVCMQKPGHPPPKPKPKVKQTAKTVQSAKKIEKPKEEPKPKPKPKEKPKEEPKPKEDPYFVTEEYESDPSPQPKPAKEKTKPKKAAEKPRKQEEPKPTPQKEIPAEKEPEGPERDPYFETEEYEAEGTLKPWEAFNAEIDCEKLRKAMKGIGTDEKAIIDIMGYRTVVQRQEVVSMFKTMFGKDLREELSGELSGNFKECIKALCLGAAEYDASEIKRAIKGLGTDEDALIEILCSRTNAQIKIINEMYKKLYGKSMEKDIKGDTSGNFRKVLISQCQGNRDESPTYDLTEAKQDAEALIKAGEKKWGTDESMFNQILCQRSFAHLRAVFDEYDKLSSKGGIEGAITSEFSGDIKNSLLAIVRVIRSKPGYFAQKMQKTMKGLGTDDSGLIRIIVSRCECDMVQIKNAFNVQAKGTLADWIQDDTSGDYKEILLALTGDRAAPEPTAEEIEEANAEPELEEVEEENLPEDPTVVAVDPFDSKKDCEVLKKAMKGLGTDEEAIIQIMGRRSNEQRLELVKMYKTMFGKDLKKELKGELSGNFRSTILGLCETKAEFDANCLRKAMKGLGTDEDCLIEVMCTRSNEELAEVNAKYKELHGKKLEDAIISETSGHLKRLLVSMLQANRPAGNTIDRRKARKDAKDLFEAGEKKFGTDESRFNVILCSRSYPQLRATFEEYEKLAGKDITESIKSEMSGDIKKGMLTVVQCVRYKSVQFAKTLYEAMKGLGTNDDKLVRTVVSRCEVDMVQIKEEFQKAYSQPLGQFIKDDISGDYRKIILILVAEESFMKK